MANQLIQINGITYHYSIQEELEKYEATGGILWVNHLQVIQERYDEYPLVMEFLSKDDYYMGNTLTKEIVPELNLSYPQVVQQLVLFALKQGWNPQKAGISIKNGMEVLRQLGYDITPIHIETETIHELLIEPIVDNEN